MQAQRSLPPTAAAIKHNVTTQKRTHVIMINLRLGKDVREKTDVGPQETVEAVESDECSSVWSRLSGDSSALRPSNQQTHTGQAAFSSLTEQRFAILSDKPPMFSVSIHVQPSRRNKMLAFILLETMDTFGSVCDPFLKHVSCQVHVTSTRTDFHIRRVRGMMVAWLS